ncbi:MAG: hypothetical protein ABR558_11210, partial [Thioalkalivibrio sp.]
PQDWQSPHSRIPVGSSITLNQTLSISSGYARVFMQDGQVIPKGAVNQYYPHCNFEVSTVSDGTARIERDTFLVTGQRQGDVQVVRQPTPMRVVSLGLMLAGEDDGTPPPISRLVHYRLHSERQPDVRGLTCHGGLADDWEARYPSREEMHQVLGGVVSLAD